MCTGEANHGHSHFVFFSQHDPSWALEYLALGYKFIGINGGWGIAHSDTIHISLSMMHMDITPKDRRVQARRT